MRPYTLCEVMLDKFIVALKPRRRNRHYLDVADEEHPTGGQLMGADPEVFAPAALRLVESGFDVIDINFGCPVKKVLGRCRGGFHLSQPAGCTRNCSPGARRGAGGRFRSRSRCGAESTTRRKAARSFSRFSRARLALALRRLRFTDEL